MRELLTFDPAASPEETLDALAQAVVDRGLVTPAVFFLELHKPLAHLSSQAMLVGVGVLAPLLGLDRFRALQATLSEPRQYELFLQTLEAKARAQTRPVDAPAASSGREG